MDKNSLCDLLSYALFLHKRFRQALLSLHIACNSFDNIDSIDSLRALRLEVDDLREKKKNVYREIYSYFFNYNGKSR